jgi:peptidoglycan L-alanyl-D-glutamate endopeptidase CwlK
MYKLGKLSRKNLIGVNPLLVQMTERAIELTTQDFGIIVGGGLRSAELQYQYFLAGNSKVDGYKIIGTHQTGMAVDLIPWNGKRYVWAYEENFNDIHTAVIQAWNEMNIKEYKLIWGGDWKSFPDTPHYELRKI